MNRTMQMQVVCFFVVLMCALAPSVNAQDIIRPDFDPSGPLQMLRNSQAEFGNKNVANLLGSVYECESGKLLTPGATILYPICIARDAQPNPKLAAEILAAGTNRIVAKTTPTSGVPKETTKDNSSSKEQASITENQGAPLSSQPVVVYQSTKFPVNTLVLLLMSTDTVPEDVDENSTGSAKLAPAENGYYIKDNVAETIKFKVKEGEVITVWTVKFYRAPLPPPAKSDNRGKVAIAGTSGLVAIICFFLAPIIRSHHIPIQQIQETLSHMVTVVRVNLPNKGSVVSWTNQYLSRVGPDAGLEDKGVAPDVKVPLRKVTLEPTSTTDAIIPQAPPASAPRPVQDTFREVLEDAERHQIPVDLVVSFDPNDLYWYVHSFSAKSLDDLACWLKEKMGQRIHSILPFPNSPFSSQKPRGVRCPDREILHYLIVQLKA